MTEPLDPDTLAEGERLHMNYDSNNLRDWLEANADALLAVARDHARLTAAIAESVKVLERGKRMSGGIAGDEGYEVLRILSAEAGDTDTLPNP